MSLEYTFKPRTIALILVVIALYLTAQSFVGEYVNTSLLNGQYNSVPSLILDEFSVNAEQTIPTWYQVILLLTAAILLALIARAKGSAHDPYRRYWTVLAVIFLYLSIDESAAIHEIFSEPLHIALHTSGILSFGWQIAAAPLLVILGFFFLRFLFSLPPHTRNLFILAGVLYVSGAFLVDAVSSEVLPSNGGLTLGYLAIGTFEEALEMAGQITFIYTLLSYMADMNYGFLFRSQIVKQDVQADTSQIAINISQSGRIARRVVPVAVLIAVFNVVMISWALSQAAPPAPTAAAVNRIPVYQTILEGFPQDNMVVTHMNGVFGKDALAVRQYAASLLTQFDNVLVVTVPSIQSSIFIAGETLPFDRESLSDYLLQQGEIEFVIFDTKAVKGIAG